MGADGSWITELPYTVAEGLTALTLSSVAVTGAGVMTSLQYIDVCVCLVQAAASWLPGAEVQEQVWQSWGVGERQGRHAEEQGLQELSTEWTQGESRALDSSLNLISTSITNTATSVWTAVSWVRWFPLVYLQKGTLGVYEAGCSSSHPTNSVKAVVETFVCLWKLL